MNILKNIFAIIVILIFVGASFFFLVIEGGVYEAVTGDRSATSTDSDTAEQAADSSMKVVNDLRKRLVDLESVQIDTEFLNSVAFRQLENNRKDPPLLSGRKDNPFLAE